MVMCCKDDLECLLQEQLSSNENLYTDETAESKTPKKKRPLLNTFGITLIIGLFMSYAGNFLGQMLLMIPLKILASPHRLTVREYVQPHPVLYMFLVYFSFIGIFILTLLMVRLIKPYRPILSSLGRKASGNNGKMLLLGLLSGFTMNAVCIGIAYLTGSIHFSYNMFQPLLMAVFFLAVFIQSSAEELVCRGFMFQNIIRNYQNPRIAILGNTLLFVGLHLANKGVTPLSLINVILNGVFCSLIVYYYDSLWFAMACHAAWNYTQNLIFGLPNSGMVPGFSLFSLDTESIVDSWAYNKGFGIEGASITTIVYLLGCVIVIALGKKQKNPNALHFFPNTKS